MGGRRIVWLLEEEIWCWLGISMSVKVHSKIRIVWGLKPGGEEANVFLAGKNRFVADAVEIWGFFTIRERVE
jgi:hypothetical protein